MAASVVLTACFLTILACGLFALYALVLLVGFKGIPDGFSSVVDALDVRIVALRATFLVSIIVWQGCAFGSLQKMYPLTPLPHGRGSGFWWIVPVANLFVPFICLRVLHSYSVQHQSRQPAVMKAGWWLICLQICIVLNAITNAANTMLTRFAIGEATPTLIAANLAANTCSVFLAVMIGGFVVRNLVHQTRLYRRGEPQPVADQAALAVA